MAQQMPSNADIRIGSIFRHDSYDDCDTSSSYYQVVGLRGKTLVELRPLKTEEYVDERCRTSGRSYHVWSRPLPGQFRSEEIITVRVIKPWSDGRNALKEMGGSRCFGVYYKEVGEDDESVIAGMIGGYTRASLQRAGKLPDWAELPDSYGAK